MIYEVAYGGERLDKIAAKTMQSERNGTVEAILDANPGLADSLSNFMLAAGTKITIPDSYLPKASTTFTLAWE